MRNRFFFLIFYFFITISFSQSQLDSILSLALKKSKDIEQLKIEYNIYSKNKKKFKIDYLPQISLKLSTPNFNRSIFEVVQPDGSTRFREQNSANSNLSLSISQILPFTGGSFSLRNSLSRLDQFGDNNTTYYSASWLNFSYTQPLSSINLLKWKRKINSFENDYEEVEFAQKIEKINQKSIELYFEVIINNLILQRITNDLKNYRLKLDVIKELIKLDEATDLEFNQNKIFYLQKKQDSLQQIDKCAYSMKEINNFLQTKILYNFNESLVPPLYFNINEEDAVSHYINNSYKKLENSKLSYLEMDILSEKSRRFLDASFNLGFGFNNSQEFSLNNILYNPSLSQSLNFGLSIPLLDWGKGKIKYQISIDKYELEKLKLNEIKIENTNKLKLLISENKRVYELLNIEVEKRKLLEIESKNIKELFFRNEITIYDFEEFNNKILESVLNETKLIKRLWLIYFKIREVTLFDFKGNEKISYSF